MSARSHPLRSAVLAEMHVRRLPRFAAPYRLMQVITLVGEADSPAARAHIDALAARGEVLVPVGKYGVLAFGDTVLVYERHTEFASYTLMRRGAARLGFDPADFAPLLAEVEADLPGEIVRSTQVALVAAADAPPLTAEALAPWFSPDALIVCDVADGAAAIASDFRLNDDGYGRLLVVDRGLAHDEPGQLVLRLQELGNYRNMALLGLPLAQGLMPTLSALESRLTLLTQHVSERAYGDDALLDELTFLSGELARLAAETSYRMSATRAYAQICGDRLAMLRIGAMRGYQSLADFTERRLIPAVRTCDSLSARLDDLLQRAAWTSELLRTRIEVALARQNRDLLVSMDRRNHVQLLLQQAVEGVSVVAISYYLVALLGYVLKAVPGISHELVIALAVPAIVATVALFVWWLHRRLAKMG